MDTSVVPDSIMDSQEALDDDIDEDEEAEAEAQAAEEGHQTPGSSSILYES